MLDIKLGQISEQKVENFLKDKNNNPPVLSLL